VKITEESVRKMLALEKKKLREHRKRDFEENRARFSAATEDAVARVLVLEELLELEEVV
jgi:hypothetical protein